MAESYVQFPTDGSTTVFNFTFDYLDTSHVTVLVDGVNTPFTWLGAYSVSVSPAQAAGKKLHVLRSTPRATPIVDFIDGSVLVESDLDTTTLQMLYIAQESFDRAEQAELLTAQDVIDAGNSASAASTSESNAATSAAAAAASAGIMFVDPFSGDGSTVAFTLSTTPVNENSTQVYISGAYQTKDAYSVTGSTLTFASAPPTGTNNIEVVTVNTLPLGSTTAASVALVDSGGHYTGTDVEAALQEVGGFTQTGTGAVPRISTTKLKELVSFEDFGAVADGATDDTVAVVAAIAAGVKLTGLNKTYAVTGNIALIAGTWIKDAKFLQLSPAVTNRRTLISSSVDGIRLENVIVDRNGDGTDGSLNDAAGIWIAGGSGHNLIDVEVYGEDMGVGIAMHSTTKSNLVRPVVHDIDYVLASATDDQVQGIWLNANTDLFVDSPVVHTLGGTLGGTPTTRYSRGIAMGGNIDCTVVNPRISDIDQGVDITGSAGNLFCTILGGHIKDAYTYGVKLANSAHFNKVIGVIASDCGYAGFTISGPAEAGLTYKTKGNVFTDCLAINTGSNGNWTGSNPTGFLVQKSTYDTDYPRGTVFENCEARDDQVSPTMQYGFRSDVVYGGNPLNVTRNCRVYGAINSTPISGFHYPRVSVKRTTNQSVANITSVAVQWNGENYDGCAMHDTSTNPELVTIREAGWYTLNAQIFWASHATGERIVYLYKNGTVIDQQTTATLANDFSQQFTLSAYFEEGDTAKVHVYQSSGGAINVRYEQSFFIVKKESGAGI